MNRLVHSDPKVAADRIRKMNRPKFKRDLRKALPLPPEEKDHIETYLEPNQFETTDNQKRSVFWSVQDQEVLYMLTKMSFICPSLPPGFIYKSKEEHPISFCRYETEAEDMSPITTYGLMITLAIVANAKGNLPTYVSEVKSRIIRNALSKITNRTGVVFQLTPLTTEQKAIYELGMRYGLVTPEPSRDMFASVSGISREKVDSYDPANMYVIGFKDQPSQALATEFFQNAYRHSVLFLRLLDSLESTKTTIGPLAILEEMKAEMETAYGYGEFMVRLAGNLKRGAH